MRGQDLQSHEVLKLCTYSEVVGKIYKEALSLIAGLEHDDRRSRQYIPSKTIINTIALIDRLDA